MSYICTNPHVYQGDPGNAPEFARTAAIECARCAAEMDADDDQYHLVFGEVVCGGCIDACNLCGEWLDDACFPWEPGKAGFIRGPISVQFREYQCDGQISQPHCPRCAGEWLLEMFTGVEFFSLDDYSDRESIAQLLAASNALPPRHTLSLLEVAHAC